MKNCEPLVFGPEFAIESVPAENQRRRKKKQSLELDAVNKILMSFFTPDPGTFRPHYSNVMQDCKTEKREKKRASSLVI